MLANTMSDDTIFFHIGQLSAKTSMNDKIAHQA